MYQSPAMKTDTLIPSLPSTNCSCQGYQRPLSTVLNPMVVWILLLGHVQPLTPLITSPANIRFFWFPNTTLSRFSSYLSGSPILPGFQTASPLQCPTNGSQLTQPHLSSGTFPTPSPRKALGIFLNLTSPFHSSHSTARLVRKF